MGKLGSENYPEKNYMSSPQRKTIIYIFAILQSMVDLDKILGAPTVPQVRVRLNRTKIVR